MSLIPPLTPESLSGHALINGQWVGATDGACFEVLDPATGRVIGEVPRMGETDTQRAIEAANAALPAWRERSARDRHRILMRWHALILEHQEALAALLVAEQGKPLFEARGEVGYGASFVEWFAEEGKRAYGETVPAGSSDRRILVLHQPIGVVGAITPWNLPSAMITRKAAPALAAGCTMVLKPAEDTPFSALALARLAQAAGVPDGVLNIITGDPVAIGQTLTASPIVRKLSFTGSTPVGKLLYRACADTVKKLALELGGNAPFIVFDDADFDAAVEAALNAKFRHTGQNCVCANRIYVQRGLYERFAQALSEAAAKLVVANGMDPAAQQGPLINAAALQKVVEHVEDARSKGAVVLTGGQRYGTQGNFFQPTVLRDVNTDMRIAHEETFGPVAAVQPFDDEAEITAKANDTEYGLGAFVFTQNLGRAIRMAENIESGIVGVNTGIISTEVAPFGGIKQSGLGREGSRHGLDDFLELKYVCLAGL